MDPKRLSFGLGIFSLALGVAELAATRRIARALGSDHPTGRTTLRAFGAREMLAGGALVVAPAHSTLVWNRVAGDAMDLAALGLAMKQAPRRRAIWGALAFVAGATVVDSLVAYMLDRSTGKAFPSTGAVRLSSHRSPKWSAPLPSPHATTIEPDEMPFVQAPEVTRH